MPDRVLVYLSAAPDLALERETLSKAIVEIPTSLGWRIKQTPGPEEKLDAAAAAQAEVHLLIMGSDIRAPVGAEWLAARRAGRMPRLFLKQGIAHTPAAAVFINELERQADWHPYQDVAELRREALKLLAEHILDHAEYYRLDAAEFQKLGAWRKQIDTTEKKAVDRRQGGAGASSVVLSPERFAPPDGTLIRRKRPPRDN